MVGVIEHFSTHSDSSVTPTDYWPTSVLLHHQATESPKVLEEHSLQCDIGKPGVRVFLRTPALSSSIDRQEYFRSSGIRENP